MLSITERANPITVDVDVQPPARILDLLDECDAQLFLEECDVDGESYPGLFHEEVLKSIQVVAELVRHIIQLERDIPAAVVFSGCGTSGRLAFFAARVGNRLLESLDYPRRFCYLIAGGDKALVTAQELQEDLPAQGVLDLVSLEGRLGVEDNQSRTNTDHPALVFVGITCGMSAAYVAGQLHHAMRSGRGGLPGPRYACSCIGFTPVGSANATQLSGFELSNQVFLNRGAEQSSLPASCERSIRDVLEEVGVAGQIVAPVVGAEAIAGSTRMKGGSATKMILEVIIAGAVGTEAASGPRESSVDCWSPITVQWVEDWLRLYAKAHVALFQPPSSQDVRSALADLMEVGGRTLKERGRILYLGASDLGVLGFVDASEQVPTFGATPEDVRGFIAGGYVALAPREVDTMVAEGRMDKRFRINLDDFVAETVPSLTKRDLVITLLNDNPCKDDSAVIEAALRAHRDAKDSSLLRLSQTSVVVVTVPSTRILLERGEMLAPSPPNMSSINSGSRLWAFASLSVSGLVLKWVLNILTTGAHILKGKVFRNRMIDLRLSNKKLFRRAVQLVSLLGHVSESRATNFVVEAIHRPLTDDGETAASEEQDMSHDVASHIVVAVHRNLVVPIALLMALTLGNVKPLTAADAEELLLKEPVVRTVILHALSKK